MGIQTRHHWLHIYMHVEHYFRNRVNLRKRLFFIYIVYNIVRASYCVDVLTLLLFRKCVTLTYFHHRCVKRMHFCLFCTLHDEREYPWTMSISTLQMFFLMHIWYTVTKHQYKLICLLMCYLLRMLQMIGVHAYTDI